MRKDGGMRSLAGKATIRQYDNLNEQLRFQDRLGLGYFNAYRIGVGVTEILW